MYPIVFVKEVSFTLLCILVFIKDVTFTHLTLLSDEFHLQNDETRPLLSPGHAFPA